MGGTLSAGQARPHRCPPGPAHRPLPRSQRAHLPASAHRPGRGRIGRRDLRLYGGCRTRRRPGPRGCAHPRPTGARGAPCPATGGRAPGPVRAAARRSRGRQGFARRPHPVRAGLPGPRDRPRRRRGDGTGPGPRQARRRPRGPRVAVPTVRPRHGVHTGRPAHKEIVFGVTSLPADLAGPEHLNHYERSHWSVENRLHWVRDVTFHEDNSQVRTGTAPRVLASLRNLGISAFRLAGRANIAHARRDLLDHGHAFAVYGI
ncbi:transposase [Streptomyces sp. NPDC056165]|uniref:transposase n=1 Tax=Streptomyces sp. NPDC056165 TaxID=3345733 RepID=UPI0035D9089D